MIERRITRRNFLKSAALVGAGSILAACTTTTQTPEEAPAEEQPAAEEPIEEVPAKEGVLLRHWSGWGGEGYTTAWDNIQKLDGFKEILGSNTLEVKLSMGEEAILTAIAGGDPPDNATNINYMGFMSRGTCMDIGDLVAAGNNKKEDFIEANWELGIYKGVQYGIPTQECFLQYGVNYNLKLIQEAGLDPEKFPETWDELLDWHIKLTQRDAAGNVTRIGVNAYGAMAEGIWDTSAWEAALSWGFDWFDIETGKFNLNNEFMVDVFRTKKLFIDEVGADNMAALYNVEGRDTWGGAYNGEVECMIIEGYWHPGETMFAAPEVAANNRAAFLPVPASRKGTKVQGAGGHTWTIFTTSKDPETIYKIGEFLNTQEPCDIIWKSQGWLPAVKSYLNTVDSSIYPGLDFYFKSLEEANYWQAPFKCEITSFVSNEYTSLREKVNRDEMTPEQAAEELQTRCETEYQNAGFGT